MPAGDLIVFGSEMRPIAGTMREWRSRCRRRVRRKRVSACWPKERLAESGKRQNISEKLRVITKITDMDGDALPPHCCVGRPRCEQDELLGSFTGRRRNKDWSRSVKMAVFRQCRSECEDSYAVNRECGQACGGVLEVAKDGVEPAAKVSGGQRHGGVVTENSGWLEWTTNSKCCGVVLNCGISGRIYRKKWRKQLEVSGRTWPRRNSVALVVA